MFFTYTKFDTQRGWETNKYYFRKEFENASLSLKYKIYVKNMLLVCKRANEKCSKHLFWFPCTIFRENSFSTLIQSKCYRK